MADTMQWPMHHTGGTAETRQAASLLVRRARDLPLAADYAPEIDAVCRGLTRWGESFPPCAWDLLGAGSAWRTTAPDSQAFQRQQQMAYAHMPRYGARGDANPHADAHVGADNDEYQQCGTGTGSPLLDVLSASLPLIRSGLKAAAQASLREGVAGETSAAPGGEQLLVLELNSGPAYLSMLLSELLPRERVQQIVSVDRGWPYGGGDDAVQARAHLTAPHGAQPIPWRIPIVPRRADIRNGSHLRDLHKRVVAPAGGGAMLFALHPCGTAALRAVQFFNANPRIELLAVKPCCLPAALSASSSGTTTAATSRASTLTAASMSAEQKRRKAVYTLGAHSFTLEQVLDGDDGWTQRVHVQRLEDEDPGGSITRSRASSWAGNLLVGCDCGDSSDAGNESDRRSRLGDGDHSRCLQVLPPRGASDAAFCCSIVARRTGADQRLLLAQHSWADAEARAVAGGSATATRNSQHTGNDSSTTGGDSSATAATASFSSPYAPPVLYSRAQLQHICRRAREYIACRFLSQANDIVSANECGREHEAIEVDESAQPNHPNAASQVRRKFVFASCCRGGPDAPSAGAGADSSAASGNTVQQGSSSTHDSLDAAPREEQMHRPSGASALPEVPEMLEVPVILVESTPSRFVEGGYAEQHYLREAPSQHDLCYELAELVQAVPGEGGESSGGGDTAPGVATAGRRFAYIAFGPTKYGVKSDRAAAERLRNSAGFPFLVPGRHFDMIQVDRLAVRTGWRGGGAKELLLALADAFHADGYPVRIKTASDSAHRSFDRCRTLAFDCWQGRPSKSRGRVGKGGWVFWYTGSTVKHPTTGWHYSFRSAAAAEEARIEGYSNATAAPTASGEGSGQKEQETRCSIADTGSEAERKESSAQERGVWFHVPR